jgi:hypothetical protein
MGMFRYSKAVIDVRPVGVDICRMPTVPGSSRWMAALEMQIGR